MTKKILITGKNSYIGRSFMDYCEKNNVNFEIDELDTHGEEWKEIDFSSYDVVYHVAGIAHQKETEKNKHLYYEVNRDLAISIAKKAKQDGVNHFIFMSTMSVYGLSEGSIDENTPTHPKNAYGKSKLQAEYLLTDMQENNFKVAIIRPPMVYGPNTVGNYVRLSKLSKITPVFPNIDNIRSMIYIENLTEFVRLIINDNLYGVYCPQNKEYVKVSDLVFEINKVNNKNVYLTKVFNPLLNLFMNISVFKKVFGNLTYSKEMSSFEYDYNVISFSESISQSEIFKRN